MEDKAMMLMISLPPSYKHFCMTLMLWKSTLNFEEVDQDVMLHHIMAQCSKEGPQDVSLERVCTSECEGKEGNGRSSRFKDTDDCFECGSIDHWK
ncbi:hypothetical protein GBA52_014576 [Prunus armeniaca]|nr:hypothetical protein GBA52_014576 [Prunus armeniaca]